MSDAPRAALDLARKVLRTEAQAILGLVDRIDGDFERAVQLLFDCRGRVIVTGMGKSGIICRKIAATLSSTVPLLLSASGRGHPRRSRCDPRGGRRRALSPQRRDGRTGRLLEAIRRIGARLIAMTGDPQSTLAHPADVTLDCSIAEEACPMNLVPTASTTAALALGDALA